MLYIIAFLFLFVLCAIFCKGVIYLLIHSQSKCYGAKLGALTAAFAFALVALLFTGFLATPL